jgi:hypothetical protein
LIRCKSVIEVINAICAARADSCERVSETDTVVSAFDACDALSPGSGPLVAHWPVCSASWKAALTASELPSTIPLAAPLARR